MITGAYRKIATITTNVLEKCYSINFTVGIDKGIYDRFGMS